MIPLIILAGPTTSGKSDTAIALAEKLDIEVINADSMQVYKYFDIGTAKPSREAREQVVHHLIDILEPDEEFNAFDFKIRALWHIEDIFHRGKTPLLVGGTGLYIKVLLEDYDCAVHISPEVAQNVRSYIEEKGLPAAYEELNRIDPQAAQKITPNDPVRIERALAVFRQTGQKFSEFQQEEKPPTHPFPIQSFFLDWNREELYHNINKRVDKMIEQGLVEEVREILNRGYASHLKPFQSIGYSQVVDYLQGAVSLDQAIYEIKRDTRHYAKRQITWFKKMPTLEKIPSGKGDSANSIRDKVLSFLPKVACFLTALAVSFGFVPGSQGADLSSYSEGIRLLQKKEYARAENQFRATHDSSPDSPEGKRALYLLGRTHAKQKEFSHAVKYLQAAVKELPQIEDYIRFDLAEVLFQSGEYAQVLQQIDSLLEATPETLMVPRAQLLRFTDSSECKKRVQNISSRNDL
jgi:tRNA dimethylallyltransferase